MIKYPEKSGRYQLTRYLPTGGRMSHTIMFHAGKGGVLDSEVEFLSPVSESFRKPLLEIGFLTGAEWVPLGDSSPQTTVFTRHQYEEAIRRLQAGMNQLEPDGDSCSICGHSDHQAWECSHNPLRALALCENIYVKSSELHEMLHTIIGADPGQGPRGFLMFLPDREEGK